ncbi:hypothetical protein Zmor_007789 [Zophobas morio]|uniref:WD repeat-containing protein 75 second beta-propeller domain-containing protein n=1 Tax=Zophobas morio TaxID=2755281 RepID=A0AA38IW90_9CUCU|nr:hypothetical protein Zmor_007789 [Zophobas morio]
MDIKVNFKAGGSFVELPPQFSSNAENVYIAWKNRILGYSTKTGAQFAEFRGIKDRIVGFGVHYYDSYECVTACSCSGEIITWKVVTFFKLLTKTIKERNIKTFHVIQSEGAPRALISFKQDGKIVFQIIELTLEISHNCGLTITPYHYQVDVSSDKYFAVVQKLSLNVVSFKDVLKAYTFCIDSPREFTCVACHPENEIILTGDSAGRVVVWQRIFTSKPSKAVFHWHTLPVKCLGFSTSGSYFYSGGDESVLVRWQLDNHYERKFLPRLASTIAQIRVSPNNALVAIATNDNAVRIVDPRFENVSLIQNLVIGDSYETGIVVDPKTKALIMNGNVGQIQFYSSCDNSLLYNVDVVGQNKVSSERNCNIENTQVSKIAISKNGLWLATVESRRDPDYSSELRLKLWKFDVTIQSFKLNTWMEDLHENHIHALAFQPLETVDDLKLVTVGGDKKFNVLHLTETETANSKSEIWMGLWVGFYHDLPCKDLSFSIDGSLVAVTFGNTVTTWLPDHGDLKCVLSHPMCKKDITHVEFGTSNQCHLLVAASSERLCVWNLLTLTMVWTVPVNVSILIADTVTTNMAIITKDNMVFVFAPISPEPVFSSDKLLKKSGSIYAAAFVPSRQSNDTKLQWYRRSPIFVLDAKKELFSLGADEENLDTPREIQEISKSLFSMTIPQSQTDKNKSTKSVEHFYLKDIGEKNMKKYLEAPIQTMIPIRIMCRTLLTSMVLQKP